MKKLIFIIVIPLLFFACQESGKIERVSDPYSIYKHSNYLDAYPELDGKEEKILEDVLGIVEKNFSSPNQEIYYTMSISFFIGEDGNIDKVMFHKIEEEVAGAIVNPEIENLFNEFLRFFENIRFTPGKIKGEAVKSAFSWSGIFHVDKNGEGKLKTDNKNANRYGLFKSLPTVPQNGDDFFVAVEQMPSPIGGISAIQQKIKYPEEAKLNGVQGRVFIKAFIDETGNVVRTEIIRGIGAGCDEVARKAVEETKFNPGKQRGKAVKTQVSIPILFKLN